jgi:hypothetical protein
VWIHGLKIRQMNMYDLIRCALSYNLYRMPKTCAKSSFQDWYSLPLHFISLNVYFNKQIIKAPKFGGWFLVAPRTVCVDFSGLCPPKQGCRINLVTWGTSRMASITSITKMTTRMMIIRWNLQGQGLVVFIFPVWMLG